MNPTVERGFLFPPFSSYNLLTLLENPYTGLNKNS